MTETQRELGHGTEYIGYSFDVVVKPVADSSRLTFTAVVHIPQGATRSHDGTELHQD